MINAKYKKLVEASKKDHQKMAQELVDALNKGSN